ncbi:MAG: thiamine pyrophosphate-binding protein [Desulfomonilia bacterium]|jgi:acetolactate synthase-1/2/3 large subunit|nr:thiamine pyrophosphate-binding protein [Deltaproteobacteria bacterium]MDX9762488.1 thiamine pyrophosphate-binding protein [Desulfomonilia bacterium]HPW68020.1 thiamine pyrophosphate-binding protein [Deltaproteobacteria bacterium]
MTDISGGHLVARYLKQVEGVEVVFSLSGGHIDRIYDGLLNEKVRLIDVRHEQAAAMMAHAWSIYRGHPGVCLVTAGPGFTNVLTGVVNAQLENAPMVVISGTAPVRDCEKGALQEMKQADMIKSTVKWCGICHDTRRIPEFLAIAFRQAVTGRKGPVFLELPPDVLNVKVSEDKVVWPEKGMSAYSCQPDTEAVEKAAELINRAERPIIIGGGGMGASDCAEDFRRFAEKTGIPFFLINTARGMLPDDHPQSLWDGGMMAMLTAASQTDLVIALGVRFNWLLMYGQVFPQAKLVRVDINPAEIDRNRAADVGLVGDVKLSLKALGRIVEEKRHDAWLKVLRDTYLPMTAEEEAARNTPSDPIHPQRLIALTRQAVGDDAIYIIDGGDTSYYGAVGFKAGERAAVYASAGGQFGCLGTGIPFALAAKLARPDKQVVLINGDGSFGLNAMEFDTAVRHGIPILCIVNNDQAWGMIKHGQELCYGGERVIGSQLGTIRYDKVVEALGGYGELVDKDADLVPAIRRALASEKPACINVMTDTCAISPMTLQFIDGLKME